MNERKPADEIERLKDAQDFTPNQVAIEIFVIDFSSEFVIINKKIAIEILMNFCLKIL